ncbi:MAG: 2-amino-4-hydroxy-6-hydroxymethyldihydropteridine diphosphokinase [Thiolinea sp.]
MPRVYLSLGSNVEPAKNICSCMTVLAKRFQVVVVSRVYQSPAEGFSGDDFLNSVVCLDTDLGIDELRISLRSIEREHGRRRSQTEKFNSRTLDIDLLLYDDVVKQAERYRLPHNDILKYGFVLYPLSEIAPELKHPVLQQTFAQLAAESSLERQNMKEVVLDC